MPMIFAASVGLVPCWISVRACANRSAVNFTLRPNFTPRLCAAFTPARVRSVMYVFGVATRGAGVPRNLKMLIACLHRALLRGETL